MKAQMPVPPQALVQNALTNPGALNSVMDMKKVKVNYEDLKKYLMKEYQSQKGKEKPNISMPYMKQEESQ